MKTVVIALISAVCGFLFASCCGVNTWTARGSTSENPPQGTYQSQAEDISGEKQQLRMIAVSLGCPQTSAGNMSLGELVLEIRSRLRDGECKVPGSESVLTDKEWKTVRVCLDGGDTIIEKIEANEKILKALRGKRILILPDDSSDSFRR